MKNTSIGKKNRTKTFVLVIAGLFFAFFSGCKKEPVALVETGTVTDAEGNEYKTVKIGTQWWMAENLKATKYRNGFPVKRIESDSAEWVSDTEGSYCGGSFGMLYNWYAVSSSEHNIAPAGWHIPSDEEWKELEQTLGMSREDADKVNWRGTNEGEKLKKTGIEYWQKYGDIWNTNERGFSALAGNCRLFNAKSGDPIGGFYMGFWWSKTENPNNNQAWYRYLDYKNANVFRFYGPKTYGFSVRCIKD